MLKILQSSFEKIVFSVFFMLVILFHISHIKDLPRGRMLPREIQTLDVIKNLSHNYSPLYPEVNFFGPDNGYIFLEFPGYHSCVYLISKITNFDIIKSARIFSLICFILALIGLYMILRKQFCDSTLYLTLTYFIVSNILLVQATSIQPEMFVFAIFIFVYLSFQKLQQNFSVTSWNKLIFILVPLILVKFSMIFLIIVPFMLSIYYTKRSVRLYAIFIFSLFVVVPILLWKLHAGHVYSKYPNPFMATQELSNWFSIVFSVGWMKFRYLYRIFDNLKFNFLTYNLQVICIYLVMGCVGFTLICIAKNKLLLSFILSFIFYAVFFNFHIATHYYYWLPFLFFCVLALGYFWDKFNHKSVIFLSWILIGFHFYLNEEIADIEMNKNKTTQEVVHSAEKIKTIIPPNSNVIVSADSMSLLYFCDFKGWNVGLNYDLKNFYKMLEGSLLSDKETYLKGVFLEHASKADYYIISDLKRLVIYPKFIDYLLSKYKVEYYEQNKIIIFNLRSLSH